MWCSSFNSHILILIIMLYFVIFISYFKKKIIHMQSELIDNLKAYLLKLNEILSMSLRNPQSCYNLYNIKYNWTTNYHTSFFKNSHTIKTHLKNQIEVLNETKIIYKKRIMQVKRQVNNCVI